MIIFIIIIVIIIITFPLNLFLFYLIQLRNKKVWFLHPLDPFLNLCILFDVVQTD